MDVISAYMELAIGQTTSELLGTLPRSVLDIQSATILSMPPGRMASEYTPLYGSAGMIQISGRLVAITSSSR